MLHQADKEAKKDTDSSGISRKFSQFPERSVVASQEVGIINPQNTFENKKIHRIQETNVRNLECTASTKNAIQTMGTIGKENAIPVLTRDCKDSQVAQIPRVMSFRLYDPPIVKNLIIQLEDTEMVGDEWLVHRYAKFLQTQYHSFTEYMNTDFPKRIYNIWSLVCLTALLGIYIWDLIVENCPTSQFTKVLQIVLIGLDFVFAVWLMFIIYYSWVKVEESRCFRIAFTWIQWEYFGLAVCLLSIFLIDVKLNSLMYFAAINSIWIITAAIIYLSLLSIAFMIILAVIEWLVRIFTCQAKCPKLVKKTKSYSYNLYCYKECFAEEGKACSVCLHEFVITDEKLVVLGCHSEHIFHEECILEWAKTKEICPICRSGLSFKIKG